MIQFQQFDDTNYWVNAVKTNGQTETIGEIDYHSAKGWIFFDWKSYDITLTSDDLESLQMDIIRVNEN